MELTANHQSKQAGNDKYPFGKRNSKARIMRFLPWIWLAACFIALCAYVYVNIDTLIDYDMSSELVLSKMIVDEGRLIFTPNWFYSSEIRFINTQLIYALYFRLFDSWAVVRMASTVTLYLLYLASYYYFCCKAKIKDSFPIVAGCLLLPYSEAYFYVVLFGLFYIPHICLSFLVLGLVLEIQNNSGKSKTAKALAYSLCILLSFLAGASGPRLIMVLFIPLLCVAILRMIAHVYNAGFRFQIPAQDPERERFVQNARFCAAAAVAISAAAAGYLFNGFVLAKAYSFYSYESLKWWYFSGDRLSEIIRSWMGVLGYRAGIRVFSAATLTNVLACLAAVFAVFILVDMLKTRKIEIGQEHGIVTEFYLLAALNLTAFLVLTDMATNIWHFVPVTVLLLPVTAIYLSNCRKAHTKAVLSFIVICGFLCLSLSNYLSLKERLLLTGLPDPNRRQVAEFLLENDYDNGYATSVNGNVITELTDGEIEIWCVHSLEGDFRDEGNLHPWLQAKDHMENRPTGKTFLLMSSGEYQEVSAQLPDYVGERVYMTDRYVICDLVE